MKLHLPIFLRKAILALMLAYGVPAVHSATLTLGAEDSLSVDYSVSGSLQDLNNGSLQLSGGTTLQLYSCGEGDGKTYTLLTGVSTLLDAEGNPITLDDTNNAASLYFDTTQTGTGFWEDAKLQLVNGALQLVLHNETVKEAMTITSGQSNPSAYQYYAGISFDNISFSSYGGAIYGYKSTITLSNNGSVSFSGNEASYGGAIYGDRDSTITLNGNGSVTFSRNTDSYSGGAICGDNVTLSNNGSVTFSGNEAFSGGAIYGGASSTITLSHNNSVEFSGNTSGGAIYGDRDSTITLNGNGSVTFSGNTASSDGGAIYGGRASTITLNGNGSVTFSGNTASSYGGAIYGGYDSTITLNGNGSVTFSGNTASSYGGAIYGGYDSTITLNGNGSVTFSGNTASSDGGAICGDNVTLSNNGSVTFSGNTASSYSCGGAICGDPSSAITLSNNGSVTFSGNTATGRYAYGGAIYGDIITLSNNGSVTFSGNTASASSSSAEGGAIYGGYDSTITLSNNGSVTFSGNTASSSSSYASAEGGAIYTEGDLSIRNNDSVEFYQNAEVENGTYRLRSIYAYGNEISLSAAAGKSIKFYDTVYIDTGATVNLNQDYTYQAEEGTSVTIRQQGDIVFTGAYAEQHLNDLLEAAGAGRTATAQEILNSRTTVVNAMTNLYGGRLRVEDGAIYQGRGITVHEDSAATVRVQNATLNHKGYDLTFNAGTTLELAGNNTITGNMEMLAESSLLFDLTQYQAMTTVCGDMKLGGSSSISAKGNAIGDNVILLYVEGGISGWEENIDFSDGTPITLIHGDLLVANYNAESTLPYFLGNHTITDTLSDGCKLKHFESIQEDGEEGYRISSSTIELIHNGSVVFNGNTSSSGGAIYVDKSNITMSHNASVTFSENTATSGGGAIYVDNSTITLSNNGSLVFSANSASSAGGALYGIRSSTITLSNNENVKFNHNTVFKKSQQEPSTYAGSSIISDANGAISASIVKLRSNSNCIFNGNVLTSEVNCVSNTTNPHANSAAEARGGAIYSTTLEISGNSLVSFTDNKASARATSESTYGSSYAYAKSLGGAIHGNNISIVDNGSVTYQSNEVSSLANSSSTYSSASTSISACGGAIYTTGTLTMQNNEAVLFEKNVEISDEGYRLRGIYVDSRSGVIHLSAPQNKNIEFRDSLYLSAGSNIYLNSDYTDTQGNTVKQQGDIIFTGAYTEAHLAEVKGSAGTAEEIKLSRTSEVNTMTNLLGGRLRVEDGAVYKGRGITAMEGSAATVRIKSATMNHGSYNMTFKRGTSLEVVGQSSISAKALNLEQGSTLTFKVSNENTTNAVLSFTGSLNIQGAITLNLELEESTLNAGMYKLLDLGRASVPSSWNAQNLTVESDYFEYDNLVWQGSLLYLNNDKNIGSDEPAIPDTPVNPDAPGGELPGGDEPGSDEPGGELPGGDEPGSDEPGGELPGGDKPGSDEPGGELPGGDEPGSDEPGGELPGGDEPGSDEPGGELPGGNDPGSDEPGGELPGGDEPGSDEPGGELPGGDEPGSDEPGGELPGGDEPGSDEPGGELPGGNDPGSDEPGGELPGGDEPGSNEPGGELPGGDEPGNDEPGGELPGGDEPGSNEPGGELPGGDKPGSDEPGGELPGGDEPEIPDTPVTPEKPEGNKTVRPSGNTISTSEVTSNSKLVLEGKGTLTLNGKVSPASISVNISKNLTLKGAKTGGALAGDGDLTKKGNGTLTLNDGNGSWTGDTYLQAGTIKVKGSSSLGKGDVYVKGGTLNLASKAIGNNIIQSKDAAIKSGKKFTGTYTLESGELQKGSTLNISRKATLEGGTVSGTLTGTGTTTVTGKVKLGDKGKITTKALTLGEDATLTTSAKGLSSKTTTLSIGEDATMSLGGKMTVDSLKMNGGTLKATASKPAAMTVKNSMELTDAVLTTNGKVTTNKLTLNDSTMSIKGAKAQNLTVKQNLTIGSGSALTLNGKLSAGSLTIKKDGMLTMTGSKPVTLKVKGALTLNEGSSIIMNYSFVQGKTYKVLTFASYSGSKDYYSIFGVEADDCTITNTGKAITLTVNTKWKPQTQQKAVSAEVSTPVVATKPQANPVADALVQSNWGQLEASRAFVNAMANRSMAVQLGNGERAVWANAIGSSSRHDTAGGHNGADTNVSGGAFGLETQVGRASLFGMALGNSWTRVSAHGFGTIEQDTTHLGIYGQTNWRSGISADWSAAYGRSESESMGSDWTQKHLQLDGRVSYNHELNARTVLSPFAGLQYYASDSATIGTTDTGSLQNLRAEIGVAASHRTGKLGVYGEIALHQDLVRNNPTVSMEGVRSTGMNPGRTGINFTIGASYELSDKWSVNASYTGEFVENANAHSANVGASYKF